ncbi:site-specific integrase [Methylopila sp. Yamaguchi]|uniref:site-specific integrase n=1 Tax=Methylopila sp. Yamaguchi TaxID=1437817 RepID=UPI000CA95BE6|nr:site-specific integrase [Methylopila sp. Yamaguchi]GBD47075.1 integrase family protein [Methylopila sp. Yamaguchi]
MASRYPRLFKRYGNWYFRAKVPEALRPLLNRVEYRFSLRTSDYAEAKRLAASYSQRIDGEIAKARRQFENKPFSPLTVAHADYLALEWFHSVEKRSIEDRAGYVNITPGEFELQLQQDIYRFGDATDDVTTQTVQSVIGELARANGLTVKMDSPAFRRLSDLIGRGLRENALRQLKRLKADYSSNGSDEFYVSTKGDYDLTQMIPVNVRNLIKKYNEHRTDNVAPKTILKRRSQIELIEELIGPDTLVANISRDNVRQFRNTLSTLPPNARKRFPAMSLKEAAALARTQSMMPMSAVSANIYLSALSHLLEFAVEERLIGSNPATNIRIKDASFAADDARHAFTIEQLVRIFNAPIYTGCIDDGGGYNKVGKSRPRRGRFWIPLIALFSGLRLQEICQLNVADIAELSGALVIKVSAEGNRRVKTEAGIRYVPIHPELVRIGLIKYVANVCGDEGRLFPEITEAKTGYYSDNFSKWFGNFLQSVGAKTPKTSFHSFRHNFRDALREADISPERVRALGGWSSGKTEDNYGQGHKPRTLAEEITKVRFDGLDLSGLHV